MNIRDISGLLVFPFVGAFVYFGYNQWSFWPTILIGAAVGLVLYIGVKGGGNFTTFQRMTPLSMGGLLASQCVVPSIFYGVGYVFS